MIIYHITSQGAWEKAQSAGQYTTPSLTSEGFIHASTGDQIVATANRFYAGQHGLLLLQINARLVRPEVRYEPAFVDGETQLFPHIYGPLNLDAVIQTIAFSPDENGMFHHPRQLDPPE